MKGACTSPARPRQPRGKGWLETQTAPAFAIASPARPSRSALKFGVIERAGRIVALVACSLSPGEAAGVAQPEVRVQYDLIHALGSAPGHDWHADAYLAQRWGVAAVLGALDWLRSDAVRRMERAPVASAFIFFAL